MKHRPWRKGGYQPTSLIAAVLLMLIVFVSVGYFFFLSSPNPSPEQAAALAELRERRVEWEAERPPAFRYVVERDCECPLDYREPFTVIEYLDDPGNQAWIDGFFVRIEEAILAGSAVSVSYDGGYGFPNDFSIAEEDTFVRDFEVLRGPDGAQ